MRRKKRVETKAWKILRNIATGYLSSKQFDFTMLLVMSGSHAPSYIFSYYSRLSLLALHISGSFSRPVADPALGFGYRWTPNIDGPRPPDIDGPRPVTIHRWH